MFKRLDFDTWDGIIPILGLMLTLAVFIVFFVRAIRMKPTEANRMSHLPLEDELPLAPTTSTESDHVH